jgi:hypothetical protein
MVVYIKYENKQQEIELVDFNLEKALSGAEVFTRDGSQVTELHLFKTKNGPFQLTGIIDGIYHHFTKDGKYNLSYKSDNDLFLKKQQIVIYKNVYFNSDSNKLWLGNITYSSEYEAVKQFETETTENYIKTIKITNDIN